MSARQTEMEIIHDGIVPSLMVTAQVSGKTLTFATRIYSTISDCWALTKPEINFLIALTTFTGFYLGDAHRPGHFPFFLLSCTLFGTLLVASGAGTLNQYIERRFDAQMRRTARRPLADGRLKPSAVLWFGLALSLIGSIYL